MTKAEERLRKYIEYLKIPQSDMGIDRDGIINFINEYEDSEYYPKDIEEVLNMLEEARNIKDDFKHKFNRGKWCELDTQLLFDKLDKSLGEDKK